MSKTLEAFAHNQAMILLGLAALVVGSLHPAIDRASETRTWRDMMRSTPFHSVNVTRDDVTASGLVLAGDMVKRRCEFIRLSAYVQVNDAWVRASLDTSPEDKQRPPGDRPPVPEAQLWGPWVISWRSPPEPSQWSIYAHHDCGERIQINLFATGEWPRG